MAMILHPKEPATPTQPDNGTDFTLAEAQLVVGGYVQEVPVPGNPDEILLVNEDGKWARLVVNEEASRIAGQTIVGRALLCRRSEFK